MYTLTVVLREAGLSDSIHYFNYVFSLGGLLYYCRVDLWTRWSLCNKRLVCITRTCIHCAELCL